MYICRHLTKFIFIFKDLLLPKRFTFIYNFLLFVSFHKLCIKILQTDQQYNILIVFSTQSAQTLQKSPNIKPKRKEFVTKLSKFLVSPCSMLQLKCVAEFVRVPYDIVFTVVLECVWTCSVPSLYMYNGYLFSNVIHHLYTVES